MSSRRGSHPGWKTGALSGDGKRYGLSTKVLGIVTCGPVRTPVGFGAGAISCVEQVDFIGMMLLPTLCVPYYRFAFRVQ